MSSRAPKQLLPAYLKVKAEFKQRKPQLTKGIIGWGFSSMVAKLRQRKLRRGGYAHAWGWH
jgi:hypothetical protein